MAKMTIQGVTFEGTAEELREIVRTFEEEKVEPAVEPLKSGDRVRVSGESIYGNDHDGETGTFEGVDEDGDYLVRFGGEYVRYFEREQLTRVSDEEEAKPKTGDIVVITANTNDSNNRVGDIGKVGVSHGKSARVLVPGGEDVGNWTLYDEMRLASPAEIKRYEDAVKSHGNSKSLIFEKAGREYGEYKVGDILRVINSPNAAPNGTIFEVNHVRRSGVVQDLQNYVYNRHHIEPIAFVENRVDRA